MKTVWCQLWEESEKGWGVRPDGYSLHSNQEDVKKYIKEYWDGMPKQTPDEYSRPVGDAYQIQASDEVFEQVAASENGVRHFSPKWGPGEKVL